MSTGFNKVKQGKQVHSVLSLALFFVRLLFRGELTLSWPGPLSGRRQCPLEERTMRGGKQEATFV